MEQHPQKTICKKCEVVPLDKEPSTLDNANMSSAERFSQRVRHAKPRKVYQGQPTHLNIYGATYTSARISFRIVGTPMYYQIIVTSTEDGKYYSVTHDEYSKYGHFEARGLIPNTLYTVNVFAHYVSGDIFPLNHTKSFLTTEAEGTVKNYELLVPTNQVFDVYSESYNTFITVSFEALRDQVQYQVLANNEIIDISYENRYTENVQQIQNLDFNSHYDVSINTIYGDNEFIYTTSREIQTVDEDFLSYVDISNVQNTFVDLSYSFIDVSDVVYKLYVNDTLVVSHSSYQDFFHLRDLGIGQTYGNVYVSVTFPQTNNEYKNRIQDFSFTTLNESPSAFTTKINNTSIDIFYIDASGANEEYKLHIKDNNGYDFSHITAYDSSFSFTNLSINTEYIISIITTYPPSLYSDVSNTYDVSQSIITLNEGPITNVLFDADFDSIFVSFVGSPNFDSVFGNKYIVYNNNVKIDELHATDTSYNLVSLTSAMSYSFKIESFYSDTSNIYIFEKDISTLSEGYVQSIHVDEFEETSVVLEIIPHSNSAPNYFDVSLNEFEFTNVSYASDNLYTFDNLDSNVDYSVTVTAVYPSGGSYTTSTIARITNTGETVINVSNENIINGVQLYGFEPGVSLNYVLVGAGGYSSRSGNSFTFVTSGANGGEVLNGSFNITTNITVNVGDSIADYWNNDSVIENVNIDGVITNVVISDYFGHTTANLGKHGNDSYIIYDSNTITAHSGLGGFGTSYPSYASDLVFNDYTYNWTWPYRKDNWTQQYGGRGLYTNINNKYDGGDGQDGRKVTIAGKEYVFGGGGGSSGQSGGVGGAGGAGGGGAGGSYVNGVRTAPTPGEPNTGGGAGGAGRHTTTDSTAIGGSGVAYLWYSLFSTVEADLYRLARTGNSIELGYKDETEYLFYKKSQDSDYIQITDNGNLPNDPYLLTGLNHNTTYDFSTNLAFLQITTLNEYAMDSTEYTLNVKGSSVTINTSHNHDYYNIEINPSNNNNINLFTNISGDSFTISNLNPKQLYDISTTSFYTSTNNSYTSIDAFTTLNEYPIDFSSIIIQNKSITITWNVPNDVSHVEITVSGYENSIIETNNSHLLDDLSINTTYNIEFQTVYNTNNRYASDLEITTLNEEKSEVNTETFLNTLNSGNTVILTINNTNVNDVSENIINIGDQSFVIVDTNVFDFSGVNLFEHFEGNVVTRYNIQQSDGIIQYETTPYVIDISFDVIMYKPLINVKNTAINMTWFDVSTNMTDISYEIQVSHDSQMIDTSYIDHPNNSFLIQDLSINTQYDISFTRYYSDYNESFFQSIETLNQGSTDPSGIIVLNSGMQGKIVVIDLSNINQPDVSSNTVNVVSSDISYSFTSTRTLFEFDVDPGETYTGNIVTTYIDKQSSMFNVQYVPDIYVSEDFSFTVQSYDQPYVINNGGFSASDITYDSNRIASVTPDGWFGASIKLGENIEGISIGHKFIENNASNNVILFKNNASIDYANLSQNYEYLFQDYYNFAYYIANHAAEGQIFGNKPSSSMIEYQFKFSSNEQIFYQSSPIVSTDHDWNKFEIKLFIPQSYKNVTLRIQRNNFELNNLFISDVSMVGFGTEFALESFKHYNILWNTSNGDSLGTWSAFMDTDSIAQSTNIYSLSTNMSIEFWLYVHDTILSSSENALFLIGNDVADGHPYIYIGNNNLSVKNKLHKEGTIVSQSTYTPKVPIHYVITYTNNKISIYKDGDLDISNSPIGRFFKESMPNDNVYLGAPNVSLGYVTKDFKLYDFALETSQVESRYINTKQSYSTIGNYYDLLNNVTNISFDSSTLEHVSYVLHNNNSLQKSINIVDMSDDTKSLDSSININTHFSLSFWAKNTTGTVFEMKDTDTIVLNIISDQNGLYIEQLNTVKIKTATNKLQHFLFSVEENSITSYLNGYLYSFETHSISLSNLNSINTIVLGNSGKVSNIELYDIALTEEQAFTAYHNHYHLYSEYNMSGVYEINLFVPEGHGTNTTESYLIRGNEFPLSVHSSDTISTSIKQLDISMSRIDLNKFNKNDSSFNIVLVDYNIGYNVKGSGNPYINIGTNTDSFVEMSILTFTLNNGNNIPYNYAITGIDNSDISTNNLNGTISNSVEVKMREDYKNEGPETLVFTIESLGIAVAADISDTTTNILSIDKVSADVSFAVTLTIPENKFVGRETFGYTIDVEGYMVEPSGNGVFTRSGSPLPSTITNEFTVVGTAGSKTFTIRINDTDATASIVLNDLPSPILTVTTIFKDTALTKDGYVDEGGTVIITLQTPKAFEDGKIINYTITGDVNGNDISASTDTSFDFNTLKGSFIVNNASADISFVINENRESNTNNEELTVTLDDFSSVSTTIFIIDTVLPIAYAWQFTKEINGVATEITSINEGETFTVTLLTQGIDNDTTIDYYIGGSNITIDDFSTNVFTGQFIVGSTMSRDYTVRRDKNTEGIETATFNISIEGEPDVIGSLEINDTSQSPDYNLNSVTTHIDSASTGDENKFNILFSIENRDTINAENPLTLSRYESYNVTGVTSGDVSGELSGILSLLTDHTLSFEKIGNDIKTFVFSIAGKILSVGLNYTENNPRYESSYTSDSLENTIFTLTTFGQNQDISYVFTPLDTDIEPTIKLDNIDVSLSGILNSITKFDDTYNFTIVSQNPIDLSFEIFYDNQNKYSELININI